MIPYALTSPVPLSNQVAVAIEIVGLTRSEERHGNMRQIDDTAAVFRKYMHHILILVRARNQRASCDDSPNYAHIGGPALLVRIPVPVPFPHPPAEATSRT